MGNGTWGNLPSGATSWSVVANNLINTNTGNVGIGTNNPQHKLDVSGSFGMNGAFVNSAWLNGGTRLLQVDASGNVSPFTMGNYNDVLFGNGTWAALPSAINYFSANGNAFDPLIQVLRWVLVLAIRNICWMLMVMCMYRKIYMLTDRF